MAHVKGVVKDKYLHDLVTIFQKAVNHVNKKRDVEQIIKETICSLNDLSLKIAQSAEMQNAIENYNLVRKLKPKPYVECVIQEKLHLKKSQEEKLLAYATRMRKNPTEAEKEFSEILKDECINFEQQYPVMFKGENNQYILDFFLPDYNVCVEIDGGYHKRKEQREKDKKRDILLTRCGIKVFRFTNKDILNFTGKVQRFVKRYRKSIDGEFDLISNIAKYG